MQTYVNLAIPPSTRQKARLLAARRDEALWKAIDGAIQRDLDAIDAHEAEKRGREDAELQSRREEGR